MQRSSLVLLAGLASALTAQSPQSSRSEVAPCRVAPPPSQAVDARPDTTAEQDAAPQLGELRPAPQPSSVGPALPEKIIFDRPSNNGDLWAIGHTWKAKFDNAGMTFIPFFGSDAPQNYPIRVELASASVGGQVLELLPGSPVQEHNAVHTSRGALVEVLDLSLRQVEQSFVFASLPNRGAVKVNVRLQTELTASTVSDGLAFGNDHGTVWYRKAIAIDAAGETLELDITWHNETASIEIPAAFVQRAQLPLVLDPILNSNLSLAPNVNQIQSEPDVATLQGPDRICTVWRRRWSLNDQDCFALITNDGLTPLAPAVAIDFTGQNWSTLSIAANANARNFLVVSQVSYGTGAKWIRGRLLHAGGYTQPSIDIEGNGVGNTTGNYYRPVVGGDPYPSNLAFYCVAWERQWVDQYNRIRNDIHLRLVDQQGGLTTPNATFAMGGNVRPSISKSNGTQKWLLGYAKPSSSSSTYDLGCRFVTWNGNPINGFLVSDNRVSASNISCGSPALIGGQLYWPVAYQAVVRGPFDHIDIFVKLLQPGRSFWGQLPSYNLSEAESASSALFEQSKPAVDWNGSTFAVCYEDRGHGNRQTMVSSLAFSPSSSTFTITDRRQGLGISRSDEIDPRICAMHSGGGRASSRFQIVDNHVGNNDIELRTYGVTTRSAGNTTIPYWSSTADQCGDLTMTPSGIPTLGGAMNFDVQTSDVSGIIFGAPGSISLSAFGCDCTLGVSNGIFHRGPMTWTIPTDPTYLGTTLAAQAVTFEGNKCLGTIDLSDTVTFTIR